MEAWRKTSTRKKELPHLGDKEEEEENEDEDDEDNDDVEENSDDDTFNEFIVGETSEVVQVDVVVVMVIVELFLPESSDVAAK